MSHGLRSLKQPILKLNRLVGHSSAKNHMSKPVVGDVSALNDEADEKELKKALKDYVKEEQRNNEIQELERRLDQEASEAESSRLSEPEHIRERYGQATARNIHGATSLLDCRNLEGHPGGRRDNTYGPCPSCALDELEARFRGAAPTD